MTSEISLSALVPLEYGGSRLDQVAADLFPEYSRSRIQSWIKSGELRVNGEARKQTSRLSGGETIQVGAANEAAGEWLPEPIDLDVVYEDEALLVVNKSAGLVVHPAAGNWSGTLLNGLLNLHNNLINIPRAGIVHRLDKDTSGLMVVAKTLQSQNHLVQQLQSRSVKRAYRAITVDGPDAAGRVNEAIGRHPVVRTRMAVLKQGGKEAITHFEVLEKCGQYRDILVNLETGRTHQIRVHMAWLGFPLVGDPVYGKKLDSKKLAETKKQAFQILEGFPRQALHAQTLSLVHPVTGETMTWQSDLPEDYQTLWQAIQALAQ